MKAKMIVTGSEGFIGTLLCEKLRELGYDVIGIDRKSGHEVKEELAGLLRMKGIECVFHLAAQTSVFNRDHAQIFHDNLDVFYHVSDLCYQHGVKLVYASSSTAEPGNSTSMYGLSKRFGERYAKIYNPKATGVRLHNVYGKNPRQGTLLWTLLNNERVTLYNGGQNTRCFTYIDDIVSGLIKAKDSTLPLLNCVNNEPMTIKEYSEKVQFYRPVQLDIIDEVREHDNPVQTVNPDIPTIDIEYTKVDDALKLIFNG